MANHSYRDTLRQPGLRPSLWTQLLGAFNDNLFKIVVDARGASGGRRPWPAGVLCRPPATGHGSGGLAVRMFRFIEAVPTLGTGKANLRGVRELATTVVC